MFDKFLPAVVLCLAVWLIREVEQYFKDVRKK